MVNPNLFEFIRDTLEDRGKRFRDIDVNRDALNKTGEELLRNARASRASWTEGAYRPDTRPLRISIPFKVVMTRGDYSRLVQI